MDTPTQDYSALQRARGSEADPIVGPLGDSLHFLLLFVFFQSKINGTNKEIQFQWGRAADVSVCFTRVSLGQKISLDLHFSNWSHPEALCKIAWVEGPQKRFVFQGRGKKGSLDEGAELKIQTRNRVERPRCTQTNKTLGE